VILVDANLLIYAVNRDEPYHEAALAWWEATLSSTQEVGLAWGVILAFLRVTTRPGILQHPLEPEAALGYVDEWLARPYVRLTAPGERHWPILRNLLHSSGLGGNLASDAHLAALALEHGAHVYSTDHDFQRFAGLRHINPLAPN